MIDIHQTPSEELAVLANRYPIFRFLLLNIEKEGMHFAARCYLSALDDTETIYPNLIFDLLRDLEEFHKSRIQDCSESPSQLAARIDTLANPIGFLPGCESPERTRSVCEATTKAAKKLYVPVTRKVSLTDETF